MTDLVPIKLGGSLLTDKRRQAHARPDTIARLAAEVASAWPVLAARGERLLLGHGSGSFGHVAAREHGLVAGRPGGDALAAAKVQDAAARLHRLVVSALVEAGVPAWSWSPAAVMIGRGGTLASVDLRPLEAAFEAGLVPVVYGDVILEASGAGAWIASTEAVVDALVGRLGRRGHRVRRVIWLGETAGILDADGHLVPRVDRDNLRRVRRLVGGAAGTDVTGGMLLRLDTARRLARRGITSLVADGRVDGLLGEALVADSEAGDPFGAAVGTRVLP